MEHTTAATLGAANALAIYGGNYSFKIERTTVLVKVTVTAGKLDGNQKDFSETLDCGLAGSESGERAFKMAKLLITRARHSENKLGI